MILAVICISNICQPLAFFKTHLIADQYGFFRDQYQLLKKTRRLKNAIWDQYSIAVKIKV